MTGEEISEEEKLEERMWGLGLQHREETLVLYYEFMKTRSTMPYERTKEFMKWLKENYGRKQPASWSWR